MIHGTTNGEVVLSLNKLRPAQRRSRPPRRELRHRPRGPEEDGLEHQGTLIGSMVPPTDPWYRTSATSPYDPAKAPQLLAAAGYAKGVTLRLRVPVIPYATASAQFVASQPRDVGITVRTDALEIPRWLDTVSLKAGYDMSIIAHVEPRDLARFADPKY